MATEARGFRTHEAIHPDREMVKEWAKATFTKERILDLVVGTSTVTILGVVLSSLYKAMENYAIIGTPPF